MSDCLMLHVSASPRQTTVLITFNPAAGEARHATRAYKLRLGSICKCRSDKGVVGCPLFTGNLYLSNRRLSPRGHRCSPVPRRDWFRMIFTQTHLNNNWKKINQATPIVLVSLPRSLHRLKREFPDYYKIHYLWRFLLMPNLLCNPRCKQ